MILTKVDDPRFLTVVVALLFSAALWIATWSVMGSMDMGAMDMSADMKGMEMSGMEASTEKPMAMDGMKAEAPMKMEGMADQSTAMEGMNMSGGAMQMDMFGMSMDPNDWSARTIVETSAMWLLMMAAMMLPAMAPVMSVYAGISVKEDTGVRLALRISLFTVSYFLLWAIFSVTAAIIQMALRSSDMFTMGGTVATPLMAGILALIAGLYQFTPIKDACLKHCRHPLHYLLQHWKPGLAGAFPVGARHGLYCFGCCVAFMGLMFIFGAMNIWWMAVIAAYFLAEKILPKAELWSRITGALLIAAGSYMIITNL